VILDQTDSTKMAGSMINDEFLGSEDSQVRIILKIAFQKYPQYHETRRIELPPIARYYIALCFTDGKENGVRIRGIGIRGIRIRKTYAGIGDFGIIKRQGCYAPAFFSSSVFLLIPS
jgi:hypothetical protein